MSMGIVIIQCKVLDQRVPTSNVYQARPILEGPLAIEHRTILARLGAKLQKHGYEREMKGVFICRF